jgi:hypothetical protein
MYLVQNVSLSFSMSFLHNTNTLLFLCVTRLNPLRPGDSVTRNVAGPATLSTIQFAYIFTDIYFVPNLHMPHRNSCCCLHLTPPVKQMYLFSCVLSSTEENSFDFQGVGRNVYLFADIAGENMYIPSQICLHHCIYHVHW